MGLLRKTDLGKHSATKMMMSVETPVSIATDPWLAILSHPNAKNNVRKRTDM